MREPVRDINRLQHMIESIDRVFRFTHGKTYADLCADEQLYYAVVKNIEMIGEATYMLTGQFTSSHPLTPWRAIIAMRHVLVHGYYQVEKTEVWNVIKNDLPSLRTQIEGYISEFTAQ